MEISKERYFKIVENGPGDLAEALWWYLHAEGLLKPVPFLWCVERACFVIGRPFMKIIAMLSRIENR